MTPDNHINNFPAAWWNERRRRDYLIDDNGCVWLRSGSPTADRLTEELREYAYALSGITLQ